MKRIVLSISIVVAMGAIAAGATGAFYNDTETSTGNVLLAGSIDLIVDSSGASYNGEDIDDPGVTWTASDLTDEVFFEFDDIKPGDFGRRHISIHVDDNEAWACIFADGENEENTRFDPEIDAGDTTDDEGELGDNISLFAWQDNDSDAEYDPGDGETALTETVFDGFAVIPVADSDSGTDPLPPTGPATTRQVTVAWCAGAQTVDHTTGDIACDGTGMSDRAQSDTYEALVILYAEQTRNNDAFQCEDAALGFQI